MSTLPQRLENRCLNCEAITHGRYCQVCGQENIEHKMNLLGMVKHFVFDLLHFDGKFFATFKKLLLKPGKVQVDYISGKRMQNLEPFKMYIFTSTIFFIIYFSFFNNNSSPIDIKYKTTTDSTEINNVSNDIVLEMNKYEKVEDFKTAVLKQRNQRKFNLLENFLIKKYYKNRSKYKNSKEIIDAVKKDFVKKIPNFIFFTMPFFVGLLNLLYRRKKEFAYSDHGIFTMYVFVFTFIFILIVSVINNLVWKNFSPSFIEYFLVIMLLGYNIYFYKSMLVFYKQSKLKTLFKFLMLMFLNFIVTSLLLVFYLIFTVLIF